VAGVEYQGAVHRSATRLQGVGKGIAIDIAGDDLAGNRRVFQGGLVGVLGHRQVVRRVHGDVQGRAGAGVGGVGDLRHGAVVVGVRGEAVVAVRIDHYAADADDGGAGAGGDVAAEAGDAVAA